MIVLLLGATMAWIWGGTFPAPIKDGNRGGHPCAVVLVKYRCARSDPDPIHHTRYRPSKAEAETRARPAPGGK